MTVTLVSEMYQWAEIARIAFGLEVFTEFGPGLRILVVTDAVQRIAMANKENLHL
ncbi:MAG: hypothetical protein QNK24_09480 [Desulfuromusa sp.]|nr:hypothetical protein [Desulfuromusa sp.]